MLLALVASPRAAERFGVRMAVPPPVPDLDRLDPSVRADHAARLERIARALADPAVSRAELGEAWGALGMWYQVYRYFDRARRAHLNAERLVPDDFRWPYYLAHIHTRQGDFNAAVTSYRRSIELRPDYVPSLVHLAELELKAHSEAEVSLLLDRALAADPDQPRALALRAQLALGRGEFEAAIALLERALERDARSPQIQYLLGTAHRGLGDRETAQKHLAASRVASGSRNEPLLDDPLMAIVGQLGECALERQNRGRRLLAEGRAAEAIRLHRQAVSADPQNRTARINLGVTLFQAGDSQAAIETFEEVLRILPSKPPHPDLARAHFLRCAVLESEGRLRQAEEHCRASLRSDPEQHDANLVLARLLVRSGRSAESIAPFDRAVERDPANGDLRFDRSLALVQADRYARAAEVLESDLEAVPSHPLLQMSLARLRAAAPVDEVRDGTRAIELARAAYPRAANVTAAETLAMSYAEIGDFQSATSWQRSALQAVGAVRTAVDPHWVGERLSIYVKGEPCRQPWVAREGVTRRIPLSNSSSPAPGQ